MAKATDKVKVTAKDGGETSPTPTKVGGEEMARETKVTQENDTTEKSPKKRARSGGNNQFDTIARRQGHVSRECPKRIADETTTNTTTNSSQQVTIEDDLDILFQNTLYVRSDDEESDDEIMEEEVVYSPTYNMSQETNNSDKVSTAQTNENHA